MKIYIYAKCSDLCNTVITEDTGEVLYDETGYPLNIESLCYGDYIELEVDLATGQICNWKPITTKEQIQEITDSRY